MTMPWAAFVAGNDPAWCEDPCDGAPQYAVSVTRPEGGITPHMHHICWYCDQPTISTGTSYNCKDCGVGGGRGFVSVCSPTYDPEFARDYSSPA
jgi:hypothetical protein